MSRWILKTGIALAISLVCLALQAHSAQPIEGMSIDRELFLKNTAEVWSETVCLSDLVDGGWINSRCAIDKAMCCRWNMGGERAHTFSRAEIQKELRNINISGFVLTLKGANEVTVKQTKRELTAREVTAKFIAAASAKLGDESSKIVAESTRILGPVFIAFEEENDWDVVLPETLTDQSPAKIVSTKDTTKVLGWAQVVVRVESEVFVSRKTIHPTEIIKPEYFELKKTTLSPEQLTGQQFFRKQQFPEMVRARMTILPGSPLAANSIERIPMVKLGDTVTLLLRSDTLKISTKAVVQGAAGIGDMVTVQLPHYNRTFRGRLVEGKLVEVWL